MTQYVQSELKRILDRIPEVDPATPDYQYALSSLELFAGIADTIEAVQAAVADEPDNIINIEFRPEGVSCDEDCATCDACENAQISSSSCTESVTAGEDKQETVEEPAAEPEESYDPVTVRRALLEAKRQGVDPKTIFQAVGATNFSDLPPEKYGAVMAMLKELT